MMSVEFIYFLTLLCNVGVFPLSSLLFYVPMLGYFFSSKKKPSKKNKKYSMRAYFFGKRNRKSSIQLMKSSSPKVLLIKYHHYKVTIPYALLNNSNVGVSEVTVKIVSTFVCTRLAVGIKLKGARLTHVIIELKD